MLRKLRIKFVCINMTIVTVMLAAILCLLVYSTGRSMEEESVQMMQRLAADPLQLGRLDEDPGAVRLPHFTVQISPQQEILTVGGGYFDLSDRQFLLELLRAVNDKDAPSGVLEGYHLRFIQTVTPAGQCYVFADTTSEQATLTNLLRSCIILAVAAFFIFLAISIALARWAVKPVAEAWEQQRQFVADASHELKTPLTVILTNAELLNSPDCTPAENRRFSQSILAMSTQMRGLVEKLLALARADSGQVKTTFSRVAFSALLEDALLPFDPLFFEQGLTLHSHIQPELSVNGNAEYLRQLADILLDNARKYTSPSGQVSVTLAPSRRNHCLLTVANTGDALSEKELSDIFKRFYRTDNARTMNHSYGLGLSIARQIVREHRGRIWAKSQDGWNYFYVELPTVT